MRSPKELSTVVVDSSPFAKAASFTANEAAFWAKAFNSYLTFIQGSIHNQPQGRETQP